MLFFLSESLALSFFDFCIVGTLYGVIYNSGDSLLLLESGVIACVR